jgi:DNA-directed RNA polymerase I, II, and III subunit RPABC2
MNKSNEIEKETDDANIDDSDDNETEINSDIEDDNDQDNDLDEDDMELEEDEEEDEEDDLEVSRPDTNDIIESYQDQSSDEDDDENEDEDEDNYLQKFEASTKKNIIANYHPDLNVHNESEIEFMSIVVRNDLGVITDKYHTTLPFITKYEKTRIIGERARQIDAGAIPFVDVEPEIIDGYLIALDEFYKKKIPFIIKRPLPNGSCEYWKVSDLEII